ncbi:putative membrane protein YkgB [Granulicella aggregans]|uniref:Putative membrane protein YkgB n=1 Tax=Granulicella aggregans TaxID=474949 RepID=A0A7W7ZHP4_9BACT|nr:DUF417 family protein [Granulicella aggregans]MBB5060068.1 putative membrane protein YkgB [Granulicella aggregans]
MTSVAAAAPAPVLGVTPITAERAGETIVRYGLVLVIAWFAIMKFTIVEAEGIKPLVTGSPLLGWAYHFLSVGSFSRCLGLVELAIACLIALRPVSARACLIGSAGGIGMFLTTLTFLFQRVAWDASLGGFPAPSAAVGEFLIKDIVLLGAAVWSFGEAWTAVSDRRSRLKT